MRTLHYDCFAGISGDMHLAALLDLGVPRDHLLSELAKLGIPGFELRISHAVKSGISGTRVDVDTQESGHQSHDHRGHHHTAPDLHHVESSRLEGYMGHAHHHSDAHVEEFVEDEPIPSPHHHHHAPHRSLSDIELIISRSTLSQSVKNWAVKVFRILGEAEAAVHSKPISEIHFHEVGALDAIVDIVGAAICIEWLAPDRVTAAPPELGSGMVKCAHGLMPVPAPATLKILQDVPVRTGNTDIEATTPTGAAILKAFVDSFTKTTSFTPQKIGIGVGHADGKLPNILRAVLATSDNPPSPSIDNEGMVECEANIDDMTPEHLAGAAQRMLAAGAVDVWITPVIMKKGRPGSILSVLCQASQKSAIEQLFFSETTTIGVRSTSVSRTVLDRKETTIQTPLGPVKAKQTIRNGHFSIKPEFDDLDRVSRDRNLSIIEADRIIRQAINDTPQSGPQ